MSHKTRVQSLENYKARGRLLLRNLDADISALSPIENPVYTKSTWRMHKATCPDLGSGTVKSGTSLIFETGNEPCFLCFPDRALFQDRLVGVDSLYRALHTFFYSPSALAASAAPRMLSVMSFSAQMSGLPEGVAPLMVQFCADALQILQEVAPLAPSVFLWEDAGVFVQEETTEKAFYVFDAQAWCALSVSPPPYSNVSELRVITYLLESTSASAGSLYLVEIPRSAATHVLPGDAVELNLQAADAVSVAETIWAFRRDGLSLHEAALTATSI